jgi:hypothetical protein
VGMRVSVRVRACVRARASVKARKHVKRTVAGLADAIEEMNTENWEPFEEWCLLSCYAVWLL